MEISGGIEASLGGRYASALFQLARDEGRIDAVERSLDTVAQALADAPDFRRLAGNPVLSRKDAGAGVAAVAGALGLDPLTTRFLGVLAANRRLSQLSPAIRAFRTLSAAHRGEVRAEIVSAHPLDEAQVDALRQQLRQRVGRDVALSLAVDPAILGGLVVRIGSRMIDSSIRTRLNALAHAMKTDGSTPLGKADGSTPLGKAY